MNDTSRSALLQTLGAALPAGLPGGIPEMLLQTAAEGAGLPVQNSYSPQQVASLAVALLELTELAADEVGMAAFETALDEELDDTLDAILDDLPEGLDL
jgi:hypothetical protein